MKLFDNEIKIAYTGVGSRETPKDIMEMMTRVATVLDEDIGITLRTGGADGADRAFEFGVENRSRAEIYLPWKGFNNYCDDMDGVFWTYTQDHVDVAREVVGHWKFLSETHKKFHIRNVAQVLGESCSDPSLFLVCWTPNGNVVGGTATAIKVAAKNGIPVYNMYYEYVRKGMETLINDKVFDKKVFGDLYE